MKLIVGLGNPEKKYENTFHNMGFIVVTEYAESKGLKFKKLDCRAVISQNRDFILAKPQTYMNLSGESVKGLMTKYDIAPSNLMVVYDDLDLELGIVRIRKEGSAGTHNGMRNIISCIKRQDFPRVRMGIGRPPEGMDVKDYVLANIPKSRFETLDGAVCRAEAAIDDFIAGESMDNIMNRYNG